MITTSYTLTNRQDEYITKESERLEIGKSEFARRVWDDVLDGKEKAAQPVAYPPLLTPQDADQGGSTTVRIWRSSHARLVELSARTGLSNADALDRILGLPDETLFALIVGKVEGLPTVDPAEILPILLPHEGINNADQFLAQKCVRGVGISCAMDALYKSYEYFCGTDSVALPRRAFWDHVNDRGFIVSMPTGTVAGIGLQKSAWAVMTGEAKGYELE